MNFQQVILYTLLFISLLQQAFPLATIMMNQSNVMPLTSIIGNNQAPSSLFRTFSNTQQYQNFISIFDSSGPMSSGFDLHSSDVLKTDGTYIYTISNSILSIISAYPILSAKVISNISFPYCNPIQLFINGNYLAVVGVQVYQTYVYYGGTISLIPTVYLYDTWVKIYDTSNKVNPLLIKNYKIQGRYENGALLSNGFVHIVTKNQFFYEIMPNPWYDLGNGVINIPPSSIYYDPTQNYTQPSLINTFSFNLLNPLLTQTNIISICVQLLTTISISTSNIYLTSSYSENGKDYTNIKKIVVNAQSIIPVALGKIRGQIAKIQFINQYNRILRIVTTNSDGNKQNNVFCLDSSLNVYGSLTGIASGQQITSVLYINQNLYLGFNNQTNPFIAVSFSNPKNPMLLDLLTIPTFVSHLYQYNNSTMIGIGGPPLQAHLQIAIFDPTNPNILWSIQQKYNNATVQYNSQAFLVATDKNLMVIPARMNSTGTVFNGVFTFFINQTYVEFNSVIDHLLNPSDTFSIRNVENSFTISNYLYTKSQCLLKINQISNYFQSVSSINIPCQDQNPSPPPLYPPPTGLPVPGMRQSLSGNGELIPSTFPSNSFLPLLPSMNPGA